MAVETAQNNFKNQEAIIDNMLLFNHVMNINSKFEKLDNGLCLDFIKNFNSLVNSANEKVLLLKDSIDNDCIYPLTKYYAENKSIYINMDSKADLNEINKLINLHSNYYSHVIDFYNLFRDLMVLYIGRMEKEGFNAVITELGDILNKRPGRTTSDRRDAYSEKFNEYEKRKTYLLAIIDAEKRSKDIAFIDFITFINIKYNIECLNVVDGKFVCKPN
ncbi:MAG: hypothetical protein D0528_08190 [Methylococcales bacterium]|nr:MAG: hypothetical protein D0528_08190 [Methylococcales bacterium]